MELKVSTAIQDGGSAWTAIEYTDTPMGAMLDTTILEKGSLTLRKPEREARASEHTRRILERRSRLAPVT